MASVTRKLFVASLACLGVACSEARDATEGPLLEDGAGAMGGGGAGGAGGNGSGGSGTGGSTSGGGTSSPLVINEISASGLDYVELYNASPFTIVTDGLKVSDDDGGAPKVNDAVDIAGLTIAPGDYVLILAGVDNAMPGIQMTCDPAMPPCFHAEYGISSSNGDVIYLLDANDGVITSAPIPAEAVADEQSYSRLPDGTGPFGAGVPTPGSANMPAP